MKATWKVIVPPAQRPTRKMNSYNIENIFSTTLRDSGEVALIDGDTKKIINIVKTGYAVHISRLSGSGRYLFVIGRDAKVNMIDLWMEKPDNVAEIRVGLEARSVDTSKYKGFIDKYAIAGTYWPPQYVIMKGDTLEPLKIMATRGMTVGDQEYHPEPRVASIVASHFKPEFVVNVKETGKILMVNYQDIDNLTVDRDRGGASSCTTADGTPRSATSWWRRTSRTRSRWWIAKLGRLAALIDVDKIPHPGRGANFVHPKLGPVWSTGHLGSDKVVLIGTDPKKYPQAGVEGGRDAHGPGRREAVHQDPSEVAATCGWTRRSIRIRRSASRWRCTTSTNLDKGYRWLPIGEWAGLGEGAKRVVQPEYNKAGDEVWFSVWSAKNQESAIVVVDDKTRKLKAVIKDARLITPTGHFNVYNTQHDVY